MLDHMFGMTVPTTAIVLTIVLAVIALAYLLFGWLRKHSARVLLRGAGFILIPIGLLVMGLPRLMDTGPMSQIVTFINRVVEWANSTVMNVWIMVGLILAGIGLVLYLVGSFVHPVTGEEAAKRREAIRDRKLAALQSGRPAPAAKSGTSATTSTAPASSGASAKPAADSTDDDKEIDEILKRHNIS